MLGKMLGRGTRLVPTDGLCAWQMQTDSVPSMWALWVVTALSAANRRDGRRKILCSVLKQAKCIQGSLF